jgi:hypothetical protein
MATLHGRKNRMGKMTHCEPAAVFQPANHAFVAGRAINAYMKST